MTRIFAVMSALDPRQAIDTRRLTVAGFAAASLILAYEPARWLISSWVDVSYQSTGAVYVAAVIALIVWSVSSPVVEPGERPHQHALLLLGVAAAIRLASQVLAINIVGGFALALDVFALLTLLRTSGRTRPLSAFWAAVLFLFTLPVERVAQRVLGYPLQKTSAAGACELLGLFFEELVCSGVRLQVSGEDVLVDLPCAGTSGLMLTLAVMAGLNAVTRPRFATAVAWMCAAAVLSMAANAVRIAALAVGLVHRDAVGVIDVMAQPLHDLIGYGSLALTLSPLLYFYRPKPAVPTTWMRLPAWTMPRAAGLALAVLFVVAAVIIVSLPRQALDVSANRRPFVLPAVLAGQSAEARPLAAIERRYFERFGGTAQKAVYGPLALTLVQSTSPLRHLHAPDDCLRGLGYDVVFLGTRFSPVPTALYRATGPAGDAWRVAVTFSSDGGMATSNVAEAIWMWLRGPGAWTSVQRITPWRMPEADRAALEAAVIAALDLGTTH